MELLVFVLGLATSLLGYVCYNFLVKPILAYRETIAKIGSTLKYYSHIITSPGVSELSKEATPAIRHLAFELEEKYLSIPLIKFFIIVGIVTKLDDVKEARSWMIFISNSLCDIKNSSENAKALDNVFTGLNIKELQQRHNNK